MHDRSTFGRAGLDSARATALASAFVSMMIGCQPAFAMQSAQGNAALLTSDPSRAPAASPARPTSAGFVDSLRQPKSVLYDAVRDVFYISNMDGEPTLKDRAGFITKLRGDGTRDELRWIDGGRNGVTLDAPKGMAITGDVLWVADIDVVRAFDAQTGAPLTEIDLASLGGRYLRDLTIGPDRAVYVSSTAYASDTGAEDPAARNRIFRVDLTGRASVVLNFARLKHPNGLVWDRLNGRFLVTPADSDTPWTWRPGSDGFAPLNAPPAHYAAILSLMERPGDIGNIELDAKRGLVYVPITAQNRVDIFHMPRR